MPDLATTLLSERIRELQRDRRSGILAVSRGDVVKGLFLQGGRIVFASSTQEADKLGESLVRLGRLSAEQLAAASQAAPPFPARLGRRLVQAGLLGEDELGRLVAHQVHKIVLSAFTWTQGEIEFHPGEDAVPPDLALVLSTHRLLLEGVRVYPDVARLEAALGDTRRRLRIATRAPFDYSTVSFSPAERTALEAAADGLTLERTLAADLPRPLLVRAAYALLAAGVLEEEAADAGVRERILSLYEAAPRATHYEMLGLSRQATHAQVAEAWARAEREHQGEWRTLEGDARLASMISTLRLRRREAHRVLSDADRRGAYDRTLPR